MTDDDLNAPLGQFPVQKRPSRGNALYAAVAIGGLGLLAVAAAFLPELVRPPGAALYAANGVPASGTAPYETPAGVPNNAPPPQRIAEVASDTTATVPDRESRFGGGGGRAADRRENHSCRRRRRARGSHHRCGEGAEHGPPGGARPAAYRTNAAWPNPAHWGRRRAAVRGLCPPRRILRRIATGLAAHCFARWRHGSCFARNGIGDRKFAGRRHPRLRALWSRSCTRNGARARGGPRGRLANSDGALRFPARTIPARTRFSRAPGKPRISTILPG